MNSVENTPATTPDDPAFRSVCVSASCSIILISGGSTKETLRFGTNDMRTMIYLDTASGVSTIDDLGSIVGRPTNNPYRLLRGLYRHKYSTSPCKLQASKVLGLHADNCDPPLCAISGDA